MMATPNDWQDVCHNVMQLLSTSTASKWNEEKKRDSKVGRISLKYCDFELRHMNDVRQCFIVSNYLFYHAGAKKYLTFVTGDWMSPLSTATHKTTTNIKVVTVMLK